MMKDSDSAHRRSARARGFNRFLVMWFTTVGLATLNGLTFQDATVGWSALALNAVSMIAAAYDFWALRQRGPPLERDG